MDWKAALILLSEFSESLKITFVVFGGSVCFLGFGSFSSFAEVIW